MKTLKTILILAIILFANTLQAQQSILAKEITVNKSQISSSELIKTLQTQTGFSINYSGSVLKIPRNIKLEKNTAAFKYFLDKIFGQQQVEYIVKEGKILVRFKAVKEKNKPSKNSNLIYIQGKVIESGQQVLPYAHIRIKNTSIGCVTNAEGVFQLKIKAEYSNNKLVVSFVGYESFEKTIKKLTDHENIICLKQAKNELSEVTVKAPDPIEILAKAILNFKQNYWQKPINAEGFYREILFQNGKAKRMAEAACEYYIEPFKHSYTAKEFKKEFMKSSSYGNLDNSVFLPLAYHPLPPTNQVKIIESRSSYDATNTGLDFCLEGGPLLPLHYDFVGTNYPYDRVNDFVVKRTFNKTYKSLQKSKGRRTWGMAEHLKVYYSTWEGKPIYIIKDGYSTYYIDKESYAIIQYKFQATYSTTAPFYLTRMNKSIKKYKSKRDAMTLDSMLFEIKYFENQGKWYYRSITVNRYNTYMPSKGKNVTISTSRQIMFHKVQTENVKPFDKEETFKHRYNSSLHYYATEYNPDFWEQYNTLYPTDLQQNIRKTLEKTLPLSEQYASNFYYDENLKTPIAKIVPDTLFINNESFPDNYKWLNTGNEDSTKAYVFQENKYTDNFFLPHTSLIRGMANEMSDVFELIPFELKQTNNKQIGKYVYYFNDSIGRKGAISRKDISGKIDTLLSIDEKSKQTQNYGIGWFSASPDNTTFCYREYPYGTDNNMDYRLVFMDIKTKNNIDTIKALTCKWLTNNSILNLERVEGEYYNRKLYYRNINTSQSKLLYQTSIDNAIFFLESESKNYVFINTGSNIGIDSVFFIKKQETGAELKLLISAKKGKEYKVEHFKNTRNFYINTNENADKWRLYKVDIANPLKENWKPVIPEDKNREIRLIGKTDSLLILSSLKGITKDILFYSEKTNTFYNDITFPDKYHTASLLKHDTLNNLIISYETYLSPTKYYSYNLKDKTLKLIGSDSVSNYDESKYVVKIENAKSRDGEIIPIVLIYNKKARKKIGKSPLLLETYGGGNTDYNPSLRLSYLPLLERGFIVGFALVRGSAELGTYWKNKAINKNTAISGNDFADAAKHLIDKKITSANKLFATGTSHGGFIMSYIANNYPELFNGIIINFPAGDLLTELSDSTNADNRFAYNMFGSPYIKKEYEMLKKIDPYQNIKQQSYPNMLYFAGWLDINVNPVIAVKQVAKLRANKTDNNLLLLRVLMSSGHGSTGEKYYTQQAWMYTFMMKCLEK